MSKAPISSGAGKGQGGASKGASSSSKTGSGKQKHAGKSSPIEGNANHMPVLQARKGQSGEYATKGKWANWSDGAEVFKG